MESMKPTCIENTVDIVIGGINVRLWLNRKEISNDYFEEQEIIKRLLRLEGHSTSYLIDWCTKNVPNLNAVQARDGACGTVVYTVPFEEGKDPHGNT